MPILIIILTVLLPPLGVFLHDGIGRNFIITLILTLLAYVPGLLFGLWVVLKDRRATA